MNTTLDTSSATVRDPSSSSPRELIASRYREIRSFSEQLCKPLETEDYAIQSMPDASPAKWHLAHTSWFFETFVLRPAVPGYEEAASGYSYLFNSYYNAVGPMHCRAQRGMISRPTVEETFRYRRYIDRAMLELLEGASESFWEQFEPVIVLGLNHEQQHQELFLTDIKHMLARNPLHPIFARQPLPKDQAKDVPPLRWASFPEGLYWIGHKGNDFAFDNEGPNHRVFLENFALASRLVTNGEYLEFVEAGGYRQPEFWLSLGWVTVNEQQWRAPLYWEKEGNEWVTFTLSGQRKLDPSEPVCHISYFEADAYARWFGARLPTEQEWEVAAGTGPMAGNFVEERAFHPRSDRGDAGALSQMFGDVWEWTRSAYAPYPRYQPSKGAIGEYNGKFMCNQYVLRGGSCATSRDHIRRTYRNFFAPDKRWQFMGIRLAKDTL